MKNLKRLDWPHRRPKSCAYVHIQGIEMHRNSKSCAYIHIGDVKCIVLEPIPLHKRPLPRALARSHGANDRGFAQHKAERVGDCGQHAGRVAGNGYVHDGLKNGGEEGWEFMATGELGERGKLRTEPWGLLAEGQP